jgi:hypothetical protein
VEIAGAVPDRDSVGDVLDLTADVPAGGTASAPIKLVLHW